MSYNILAPCYSSPLFFPNASEEHLNRFYREDLLFKEILAFRPDVIGFQELEEVSVK